MLIKEQVTQFETDVLQGLSKAKKSLSSKYFYDDTGDKLFQEIMKLEEYYLPECELEILHSKTREIARLLPNDNFHVVELGAGDGTKTRFFLEQLVQMGRNFTYYPLDISPDVLETNSENILRSIPTLNIQPIAGDYFHTLKSLDGRSPKVFLFLGSNIGNFDHQGALDFLQMLYNHLVVNDVLLMGIDLQKNPQTILDAYNDKKGVTKRFNLNLLERINRELNGTFDIEKFDHYPYYDPVKGITYSYLVSLEQQTVHIADQPVHFKKNELIHTEISRKFSLNEIDELQQESGFESVCHFLDSRSYFTVSAFKK